MLRYPINHYRLLVVWKRVITSLFQTTDESTGTVGRVWVGCVSSRDNPHPHSFCRSKGVKKRRGVVRATNSAQMGDEYVGDGDERGLVMATEASIERNRARSASEGSQDEDEQEEEDTTGSASHADVDVLPVYVADMLRMEKAAGGGVRRFGGTGMNRSAVAPSGGTLSSSIDRAGADADALDVCIDAIEVATSITDVAVRSSERNPATGSSRSSSVMPPSHSTVPVLAEGHPVDGGRPSAAAKASAAVSAVTGLQYSDRGLPFCSGHRMECRARKASLVVCSFFVPFMRSSAE